MDWKRLKRKHITNECDTNIVELQPCSPNINYQILSILKHAGNLIKSEGPRYHMVLKVDYYPDPKDMFSAMTISLSNEYANQIINQ